MLFGKKSDKKRLKAPPCGAVIVAAGSATRMGGIDKIMAPLGLDPMIVHSVAAFEENPFIQEIVVVTRPDLIPEIGRLCRERGLQKVGPIVAGGETRTQSVTIGLKALSRKVRLAAIHDGARPLVSQEIITSTVLKAADTNAAAPAIRVRDTIKIAERGVVLKTPERETLFAVQTPQIFDIDLIRAALFRAESDGVTLTDDCAAVERIGMKVHLTEGSEENLKITTPQDLMLADAILAERGL